MLTVTEFSDFKNKEFGTTLHNMEENVSQNASAPKQKWTFTDLVSLMI